MGSLSPGTSDGSTSIWCLNNELKCLFCVKLWIPISIVRLINIKHSIAHFRAGLNINLIFPSISILIVFIKSSGLAANCSLYAMKLKSINQYTVGATSAPVNLWLMFRNSNWVCIHALTWWYVDDSCAFNRWHCRHKIVEKSLILRTWTSTSWVTLELSNWGYK